MLRVTERVEGAEEGSEVAILGLVGTLSTDELEVVEAKLDEHRRARRKLALDLKDLREVDRKGCEYLRALEESGVDLRRMPQFLSVKICCTRHPLPGDEPTGNDTREPEEGGNG